MRRLEEMSDIEIMIEKERTRIFKEVLERCNKGQDTMEVSILDLYSICHNKKEMLEH